jgi:hypothetical protein
MIPSYELDESYNSSFLWYIMLIESKKSTDSLFNPFKYMQCSDGWIGKPAYFTDFAILIFLLTMSMPIICQLTLPFFVFTQTLFLFFKFYTSVAID